MRCNTIDIVLIDDIVLTDETRDGLSIRLERWRQNPEFSGFKINRLATEYLRCSFSGGEEDSGEVTIDGVIIPMVKKFRYLGSIILMRTLTTI